MTRVAIIMLALAFSHGAAMGAANTSRSTTAGSGVARPATVVRASRSGRLVRSVVVPQTVVRPKVVSVQEVKAKSDSRPVTNMAELDGLIDETARAQGVDPLLVHAVIHVESDYNQFALSYKGAEGLMQLIPGTARRMGVRNSFDIRQNLEGGVKYLRQMLDRFDDLRFAIAAYNAGPEAVARYNGIPPYAETVDYVYRVGKRYGELRRLHPPAPAPVIEAQTQPKPEFAPLETYIDDEGRLNMRTR